MSDQADALAAQRGHVEKLDRTSFTFYVCLDIFEDSQGFNFTQWARGYTLDTQCAQVVLDIGK